MDPRRLQDAYEKLESLDERLTYKIRPRAFQMRSPTADQVDDKLRQLADYTIELKEILRDFMLAFARRKKPEELGLAGQPEASRPETSSAESRKPRRPGGREGRVSDDLDEPLPEDIQADFEGRS